MSNEMKAAIEKIRGDSALTAEQKNTTIMVSDALSLFLSSRPEGLLSLGD